MIKLQNVSKTFGTNQVLKDITFTVETGEIFGLIGKNGAGKTTLISIIAGLSNASTGNCYINDVKISKDNHSVRIGYLPDVPAFFDFLTVDEYMDFLFKQSTNYKTKKEKILNLVKLNPKTVIKTMSRGMRQRLGLAATLVDDPEVILLDEPSSALDPMGRYELSEILLELKKQKKSIILSTHILTDMETICDKVGFLHNGVIVKTVSPNNISEAQAIKIVFSNEFDINLFKDLPFTIKSSDKNTLLISGDILNVENQKMLFEKLASLNLPIQYISTVGADLDAIFREVCVWKIK